MSQNKHKNDIFAYLILISLILAVICLLAAIALFAVKAFKKDPAVTNDLTQTTVTNERPVMQTPKDVILGESNDAGMSYIDQMIFFGESTTTHLRSRGVLTGGKDTTQVWADSSGTKTLSARMLYDPIIYPQTGENLMLEQALALEKPAYLVLSFGLNNVKSFLSDKSAYVNSYLKLIDAVQKASPDTCIILQTIYPVSASCDDFHLDGAALCQGLNEINGWLPEIAAQRTNVRVVDTASVLKGADGTLDPRFDNGDGIHLSTSAYEEILYYLRTHAWN